TQFHGVSISVFELSGTCVAAQVAMPYSTTERQLEKPDDALRNAGPCAAAYQRAVAGSVKIEALRKDILRGGSRGKAPGAVVGGPRRRCGAAVTQISSR